MAASRRSKLPQPDTITDPVDWAAHYWEQQNLEGDETRFLAMSSLLRLERLVVATVEVELKKYDLNLTDYLVLMTLQLSETGTRLISSLARNLMVHATTATLAVDRLEGRGMLARSPHPTDRRATCVTITSKGRDTGANATKTLTEVEFGFKGSTPTNITRLINSLAAMRKAAGDA